MLHREIGRKNALFIFSVKNNNFKKRATFLRKHFIYWKDRKVLLTFVLDFVNGTYFIALLLATYLDTGSQREIVLCEYDTYGLVCMRSLSIAVIDFSSIVIHRFECYGIYKV